MVYHVVYHTSGNKSTLRINVKRGTWNIPATSGICPSHWSMRAVLNHFSDDDYDELLGLLNGKTLALLRIYNRDQLTGTGPVP